MSLVNARRATPRCTQFSTLQQRLCRVHGALTATTLLYKAPSPKTPLNPNHNPNAQYACALAQNGNLICYCVTIKSDIVPRGLLFSAFARKRSPSPQFARVHAVRSRWQMQCTVYFPADAASSQNGERIGSETGDGDSARKWVGAREKWDTMRSRFTAQTNGGVIGIQCKMHTQRETKASSDHGIRKSVTRRPVAYFGASAQ